MNKIFNELSIKSRLILMLLFVTLLSSLVIGYLGWSNGRSALNRVIFNQLTSIRSAQAYQIETYFDQVFSQTRTLAEDRMIVNAIKQFSEGYEVGLYRSITDEQNDEVTNYYDDIFVPQLAKSVEDMPLSILYRPRRSVASYFQYHYIVSNPFPIGQKDEMALSEGDTTIYNRFHQFYQPIFRNLLQEFEYYDIFLIDIETSNIVYSVFKETDFATSLKEGPYRESGLGVLTNRIREEPERGEVVVIDFRSYAPSYGAPAAFVGAPIFDGTEAVGILAIQLSADEINRVMTGDGTWMDNGLGQTGESYLVGPDRLMRSSSRLFLEDENTFYNTLRDYGLSETTIGNIENFNTTILMQPVATESVNSAFNDLDGTHISTNYLGQSVLSSYAPLNIHGLEWIILSEMTEEEAFTPIFELQRNILIWGLVLVLSVAFLAILLSRYFVRPIEKLTQGVLALNVGDDDDVNIDIESNDEFGDLAQNFNTMVDDIREQSAIIEAKKAENQQLLLNILPAPIAERVQAGERVVDNLQQVSIVYIHILGFAQFSRHVGAEESAEHLETIINLFDNAAEGYDVERVRTVGDTYLAACGITTARLDHAKRTVDFAAATLKILQRFNREHHSTLKVQIGIDSGSVISGVVGSRRFNLELWGETMDVASRIHTEAVPDTILISADVYERVSTYFNFTPAETIRHRDQELALYQIGLDALEHPPMVKSPLPSSATTATSEAAAEPAKLGPTAPVDPTTPVLHRQMADDEEKAEAERAEDARER